MSVNFNNVASNNPTKGYIGASRTIQQKREYTAPDSNPITTAYDELEPEFIKNAKENGLKIRIANEEQFWQESQIRKQAQTLMSVCAIYADAGIDDIAPQNYENISDTDRVLPWLDGTPLGRWACVIGSLDEPDVERTAMKIAEMNVWYADYYSDEEIKKRIDDTIDTLGLSGKNIDKEFLFNTTKAAGSSYKDTLDASNEEVISAISLHVAQKMYNTLVPEYDYLKGDTGFNGDFYVFNADANYDSNFKDFMHSYSDLVRNAINECTNLLNSGTDLTYYSNEDDISILRQTLSDNSDINFNVGGKVYTLKELNEHYKHSVLFG